VSVFTGLGGIYFSVRQKAVVLLGNVIQFLQVEWNDLIVQGDQFVLFHLVIGFVGHDSNFFFGLEE
jgi:hypothetical protein